MGPNEVIQGKTRPIGDKQNQREPKILWSPLSHILYPLSPLPYFLSLLTHQCSLSLIFNTFIRLPYPLLPIPFSLSLIPSPYLISTCAKCEFVNFQILELFMQLKLPQPNTSLYRAHVAKSNNYLPLPVNKKTPLQSFTFYPQTI